ncbi:MAG: ribonuclease III [Chlamydiia bacterium]|nr:ribonuclease III [Chlamydiia bacterium]
MKNFFNSYTEVEHRIDYTFKNKDLLATAFVHCSYVNEHSDEVDEHNERLEFLGDSVLGMIIAEYLYLTFPSTPEGVLSDLRARLVEASTCAYFVQRLKVVEFLLLGKGEQRNDGRGRESILADLFEAILGAIFLDGGIDATKRFFFNNFKAQVEQVIKKPSRNFKAEFQDYAQKMTGFPPTYEVVEEKGPAHEKHFRIVVKIKSVIYGEGEGKSKKEAQQAAAKSALCKIERGYIQTT